MVWNIFYVSIYWECHHPNWLAYFSEGWLNHQPVICSSSMGRSSPNSFHLGKGLKPIWCQYGSDQNATPTDSFSRVSQPHDGRTIITSKDRSWNQWTTFPRLSRLIWWSILVWKISNILQWCVAKSRICWSILPYVVWVGDWVNAWGQDDQCLTTNVWRFIQIFPSKKYVEKGVKNLVNVSLPL